MTPHILSEENTAYAGSGGVSQCNRNSGFRPAFRDEETGAIYIACFADGSPAPMHVLDGLPDEVVIARTASGRVLAAKPSVISGFVREGCFFTREQASQSVLERPSLHFGANPSRRSRRHWHIARPPVVTWRRAGRH